jgi:type II secretory pathway pseudopilin PulG
MTTPAMPPYVPQPTRTSGLAIAGFVCSFFCGLIGLILSILGRNECKRSGGTIGGEGLALAGIIISSVTLALGVLGILAAVAVPSFMDYTKRSKRTEAELMLRKLEVAAKIYAAENQAFPRASAPLTPTAPCCAGPGHRCNDPKAWRTPEWQQLNFEIDEPHLYQYAYESDGKTFTARAVGDLDCDGSAVTYEIRGMIGDSGIPRFTESGPIGHD